MTTPFKFPLEDQRELFPDLKHDSTYGYEDTSSDWGRNSRLMKTELIKYFEYDFFGTTSFNPKFAASYKGRPTVSYSLA